VDIELGNSQVGNMDELASNQVRLGTEASDIDDYYNGMRFRLLSGYGKMLCGCRVGMILDYDGDSKITTLSQNFVVPPDEGDTYRIQKDTATPYVIDGATMKNNGIGFHIGMDTYVTIANSLIASNFQLGIAVDNISHPYIYNNEIRHNADEAGLGGQNLDYMPGHGTGGGGIGQAMQSYATIFSNHIWGHIKGPLEGYLPAQSVIQDLDSDGIPDLDEDEDGTIDDDKVYLGSDLPNHDVLNAFRYRGFCPTEGSTFIFPDPAPQVGLIRAYDPVTKVARFDRAFLVKPAEGERYLLGRDNFAIGVRGETRLSPRIPRFFNNDIHDNFMGMAIGNRDRPDHTPNPEVFNNMVYNNGRGCARGYKCGGGIDNRADSHAYIHDNTVYNQNKLNNFGFGLKETAHPSIANNLIFSNQFGIAMSYEAHPTIDNNEIVSNVLFGIAISDFTHPTIFNNSIRNNQVLGIALGDPFPTSDAAPDPLIYDNIIHDNSGTDGGEEIVSGTLPVQGGSDYYQVTLENSLCTTDGCYNEMTLAVSGADPEWTTIYDYTVINANEKIAFVTPAYNTLPAGGEAYSIISPSGGGIGIRLQSAGSIYNNTIYGHTGVNNFTTTPSTVTPG
jgi:parallel beta-helix repeat protein